MKIAYFLDIPRGLGGAGNILLEQAKIISRIHDVIVVSPLDEKEQMNEEYLLRCRDAHLRCIGFRYTTAFNIQYIDVLNAQRDAEEIKKWADKEHIDFFHSVQLNIAVELASRELGIPHLMNIYQLQEEEFVFKYMDIFPRYHSCDSLLYCDMWERNLGVKTCCIRPSAPRTSISRKRRLKKEQLNILMLGGLCERKNQMTAIRAVEYCNKNGCNLKLTIAGDDATEYGKECREYIRKQCLNKDIFIIGFHSNIEPLLLDNDCYLCTSNDESFPSSIVEAITYDLTIISTPVAGVPELLRNGENAYISHGYTEKDIAYCLMRCLSEYKNGAVWRIHDRAEIVWQKNFSPQIIKAQLNAYYQDIIGNYQKEKRRHLKNKISVYDIRNIYEKICGIDNVPNEVLSRAYYYACLERVLSIGEAYIWGAGKYGRIAKELLDVLFPYIRVLAFVDRNKKGNYLEVPIISPERIKEDNSNYVFLGYAGDKRESIDFLQKKGFKYNKNIWLLP